VFRAILIPIDLCGERWYLQGVPANAFQRGNAICRSILSVSRMTGETCPSSWDAQSSDYYYYMLILPELSSKFLNFGIFHKSSS